MPDKRTHRGPNPQDNKLFAAKNIPFLRQALADYSLLLSKGYAEKSSLKLVGDRFNLTDRQRTAIMRCACSDPQLQSRLQRQVAFADLKNASIAIDGYNLLITIEAALSAAPIFIGRDGCCRDLAGLHGTYKKVQETIPAISLIGAVLQELEIKTALWLFDRPVSNSGRLKTLVTDISLENNWPWDVILSQNPDAELSNIDSVIVSSDSLVLDTCRHWMNLAAHIIKEKIRDSIVIDLSA